MLNYTFISSWLQTLMAKGFEGDCVWETSVFNDVLKNNLQIFG